MAALLQLSAIPERWWEGKLGQQYQWPLGKLCVCVWCVCVCVCARGVRVRVCVCVCVCCVSVVYGCASKTLRKEPGRKERGEVLWIKQSTKQAYGQLEFFLSAFLFSLRFLSSLSLTSRPTRQSSTVAVSGGLSVGWHVARVLPTGAEDPVYATWYQMFSETLYCLAFPSFTRRMQLFHFVCTNKHIYVLTTFIQPNINKLKLKLIGLFFKS